MSSKLTIQQHIDTSGTRCPLPLLRAKQALRDMQVGELLEVLTTDPGAEADFKAMLQHLPHELVDFAAGQGEPRTDRFIIKKG